MDNETLLELLRCHSTPGDEGEVAALLAREWQDAGWSITRHGAYTISARCPGGASRKPRLLITAHMNSPGFTVERRERKSLYVLPLGGAGFQGKSAPAILKTAGGKVPSACIAEPTRRAGAPTTSVIRARRFATATVSASLPSP